MTTARPRDDRFELVDGSMPPPTPSPGPGRRVPVATVIVLATAALLAAVLLRQPAPEALSTSGPTPAAAALPTALPPTDCDLGDPACRITQARRWRDRTAAVLRSRLDPKDRYFSGYSYGQSAPYAHGSRLGALGLEVYRLEGGGTEVFIQIAKTPADAVRCGELTRHRCSPRTAANGARLWTTTTTRLSQGIEVRYIPTGSYVITIVGRNTTTARPLELDIEDLIVTAQDPRLQPPPN